MFSLGGAQLQRANRFDLLQHLRMRPGGTWRHIGDSTKLRGTALGGMSILTGRGRREQEETEEAEQEEEEEDEENEEENEEDEEREAKVYRYTTSKQ